MNRFIRTNYVMYTEDATLMKPRESNTFAKINTFAFTFKLLHWPTHTLHMPTPHTHTHSGGTHSRLTTSTLLRLLVLESLVSALACTLVWMVASSAVEH